MKIEVKKLNALKKYDGGFEFEYQPPDDLCTIPLCKIEGAVMVKGSYEIYQDDSVGISFNLSYLIKGQCSYCLSDASCKVEQDFDVLFVTKDDKENYLYDGININLKIAVDDAILFSQPSVLLCKDDCKGIEINNNISKE